MTNQETELLINYPLSAEEIEGNQFEATYADNAQAEFIEGALKDLKRNIRVKKTWARATAAFYIASPASGILD
jgi:hypothetical protein